MADETRLSGDSPRNLAPPDLAQRLTELEILPADTAQAALNDFEFDGDTSSFSDFLIRQGVLTEQDLKRLEPEPQQLDAPAARASLPVDSVLGQSFSGCTILRKLGEGGMGTVYLARRESDDLQVVIKFLAEQQAHDDAWRGRFLREAHVLKRASHPHTTAIYHIEGDGHRPHIVMEYVDGEALDEHLQREGALLPDHVLRIGRDVALALQHAHDNGVIHRDIKPANLMLTSAGAVKILDFGLAKNVLADDGLSMPGQILGTPHYMAPEQWGDHAVDHRCDLFGLGATLYHLLTGQRPFPAKSPQEIARRATQGEFAPPSQLAPHTPRELELALFRLLEPQRRFRYPSARHVANDLARILSHQPIDVPRLEDPNAPPHANRFPLLPGSSFRLGREAGLAVSLADPTVSRQHAEIVRGDTGFLLRDLDSSLGTLLNGMKIREASLKNQDTIQLGKTKLVFHDAGLNALVGLGAGPLSADQLRTHTASPPTVAALLELSDRRLVPHLISLLPTNALEARVDAVRTALRDPLGGEHAEQIAQALDKRLRRQRRRATSSLFALTHENRADDPLSWLQWWDSTRDSAPSPITPNQPTPATRLHASANRLDPFALDLDERPLFTIGREDSSDIVIPHPSVSRHHASLLRLGSHLVIRDEGSRFGTLLNDQRIRLSFLTHGDTLTLGKVKLRLERFDAFDPHACDPELFLALLDLKHPAATAACLSLQRSSPDPTPEAQRLLPEHAPDLAQRTLKHLERIRRDAHTLLTHTLGPDPQAWPDTAPESLGPQLHPAGLLPQ